MENLSFEDGVVEFNLNGKASVCFNPTDLNFSERIFDAFEDLSKKQDGYQKTLETIADNREKFSFVRERDKEMRNIIDGIFDAPVSDAVFGKTSVYAYAGGLPIWCNFMFAVMDKIDTAYAREQKATNAAIQKYKKRYQK